MSPNITFVFFLWRLDGTTPKQFFDYYENRHLPWVANIAPQPPSHERSYPVDSGAIVPANRSREGIHSFDSVTTVTFPSLADFEARMSNFFTGEGLRKEAEADENRFTQSERRVSYVARAESSEEPDYERFASTAVHIMQISRRSAGVERDLFKSSYEAEIATSEPLPGTLRHTRYYLLPEDPQSFSRGAWGDQPENAMDVVQDIAFRNDEFARQGIEKLQTAARASRVLDGAGTLTFYAVRTSGVRNPGPVENSHTR